MPITPHTQFQYPLFRIELLSRGHRCSAAHDRGVSISALSDRIAQPKIAKTNRTGYNVSISALSDRIAQPKDPYDQNWLECFNIRSFGSNCSASCFPLAVGSSVCFNIRSFGSNCSAAGVEKECKGQNDLATLLLGVVSVLCIQFGWLPSALCLSLGLLSQMIFCAKMGVVCEAIYTGSALATVKYGRQQAATTIGLRNQPQSAV